jgi:uncharacterized membrane protein (DUF373 family)
MQKIIDGIEILISYVLIIVGLVYAAYQASELLFRFLFGLWESITSAEFLVERPGRPLAGLFFSVLLTLELVATVRVFAADHLTKIRIILLVGMIAVSRKILEMDMTHMDVPQGLTISAMISALSVGYFLVSRASKGRADKSHNKPASDPQQTSNP